MRLVERERLLPGDRVPDAHHPVGGSGADDSVAGRAPGDREHRRRARDRRAVCELLRVARVGGHRPGDRRRVLVGAREELAARAVEAERPDRALVRGQVGEHFAAEFHDASAGAGRGGRGDGRHGRTGGGPDDGRRGGAGPTVGTGGRTKSPKSPLPFNALISAASAVNRPAIAPTRRSLAWTQKPRSRGSPTAAGRHHHATTPNPSSAACTLRSAMRRDFVARYGPWALVGGASEGIGAAFAEEIASRGLNVALVARRPAPLEQLAQQSDQALPRRSPLDPGRPRRRGQSGHHPVRCLAGVRLVWSSPTPPCPCSARSSRNRSRQHLREIDLNCRVSARPGPYIWLTR